MRFLDRKFQPIPDHRASNARYSLADGLKSAFANVFAKCPSLLNFTKQTVPEQSNLRRIYRINGAIPCDNQMRGILDPLNPARLRPLFRSFFLRLREVGLIRQYQYWQQFVIVSVDGVEHFSSTKVHCPSCTTPTHRNGVISYHHAGLAAVLLHPAQVEVFPLDFEPILRHDGAQKNDCERTAVRRLCEELHEHYNDLTHPVGRIGALRQRTAHPANHRLRLALYIECPCRIRTRASSSNLRVERRAARSKNYPREMSREWSKTAAWTNNLCLCESATDVKVNFLLYEQTTRDRVVRRCTWIINLPLQARGVEKVMRAGRARWQIEHKTLKTLKNQGYHFAHHDGHGEQHLATVLARLLMVAFLIDQIQQRCCALFRQLWKGLGTKAKLWATLRSVLSVLMFETMEALYRYMASLYRLQLE